MNTNLQLPDIMLYETTMGKFFLPKETKDPVVNAIKNNEIWEEVIVKEVISRVKSDSVILDLGSNFGQMTVLFSKHLSDNGLVISVESNPWIYYALSKTVAANKCKNVRLINAAVWDIEGEDVSLDFDNCEKYESYGSYGVLPNKSNLAFNVKTITVDSLNLPKVDFIKIDVQGSDLRAMQGARNTILRCKPAIIFEYEVIYADAFATNWLTYENFMHDIGYKIEKVLDWGANHLIVPK